VSALGGRRGLAGYKHALKCTLSARYVFSLRLRVVRFVSYMFRIFNDVKILSYTVVLTAAFKFIYSFAFFLLHTHKNYHPHNTRTRTDFIEIFKTTD